MSVTQGVNERLAALTEAGVSIWLDQIRRSLIDSGELERMVREESLRGVTANPSIFEKAILGSPDYDRDLAELARQNLEARDIYRKLAVEDVSLAADVLRPVWEGTGGVDGYVSLEVAPRLAYDTEGTLEQARQYWELIGRPNAMIKIPGTEEGIPAIEQATFEGININVTLLFAVEMYEKAAEAFIRGLERRREDGRTIDDIHSVASFFVSRVDTEADKRLEAIGGQDQLLGKLAIANAKLAYQTYREVFMTPEWEALEAKGATKQRCLWASTSTKNPAYRDVVYVEELIGPETVDTMPAATVRAFQDHGRVAPTLEQGRPEAHRLLARLADVGIDYDNVVATLEAKGIEKFVSAFAKLLVGLEAKEELLKAEPAATR